MPGMEWVGCRLFARGNWKNDDEKGKEVELPDASEGGGVKDGIIVDDGDEEEGSASKIMPGGEIAKRWIWIVRCVVGDCTSCRRV
jgi:hypothetical protein